MAGKTAELGSAELQVLKTLWALESATVREVMNELHRRGRKVAYTTVLTVLSRLEQKSFVRSDKSGVAYVYRPQVTAERITRSRLRALIDTFYDGAAAPLVLQLMQEASFTADELAELQSLIDRLDATGNGHEA